MDDIFEATGKGYEGDTTFDGYHILAEPMANREDRVFGVDENGRNGTCYRAHSLKLAVREDQKSHNNSPQLYILMENGLGRMVLAIPQFYDRGVFADWLINAPPEVQYPALKTMFSLAQNAARVAQTATSSEYAQAFIDGRLKKSRPKQGRVTVRIEPRAAPAERVQPSLLH